MRDFDASRQANMLISPSVVIYLPRACFVLITKVLIYFSFPSLRF